MTVTTLTRPEVPPDQRRQRLIDLAVELDGERADLETAIRDRLLNTTSAVGIELNALLRCAAWLSLDHLSGHLADVADAAAAVQRHGATTGHDECCSGECLCRTRLGRRCATCEAGPHERLEQQVDQLLGFLRHTISERAVDEYLAGAA